MPKVYGPPIPARVLICLSAGVLNANMVRILLADADVQRPFLSASFGVLYAVAVFLPQLFAFKHRKSIKNDAKFEDIYGKAGVTPLLA